MSPSSDQLSKDTYFGMIYKTDPAMEVILKGTKRLRKQIDCRKTQTTAFSICTWKEQHILQNIKRAAQVVLKKASITTYQ